MYFIDFNVLARFDIWMALNDVNLVGESRYIKVIEKIKH